jgi:hypothetical protein
MTLVWGRPLVSGGAIVTAELADLAVDQCALVEERFTLLAPDGYRGDTLDCKLFDKRGTEIARESLYRGGRGRDVPGLRERHGPAGSSGPMGRSPSAAASSVRELMSSF